MQRDTLAQRAPAILTNHFMSAMMRAVEPKARILGHSAQTPVTGAMGL